MLKSTNIWLTTFQNIKMSKTELVEIGKTALNNAFELCTR